MATVSVSYLGDNRFSAQTRGHTVAVDQPGGPNPEIGPTPVELMVMSLATCVAHYANEALRTLGIAADGLAVRARWSMRQDLARIGRIQLSIELPPGQDAGTRAKVLEAVELCTVHNTLRQEPLVEVVLAADTAAEHLVETGGRR